MWPFLSTTMEKHVLLLKFWPLIFEIMVFEVLVVFLGGRANALALSISRLI